MAMQAETAELERAEGGVATTPPITASWERAYDLGALRNDLTTGQAVAHVTRGALMGTYFCEYHPFNDCMMMRKLGSSTPYRIDLANQTCTCKAGQYARACKHVPAAVMLVEQYQGMLDRESSEFSDRSLWSELTDLRLDQFTLMTFVRCTLAGHVPVCNCGDGSCLACQVSRIVVKGCNECNGVGSFPDTSQWESRCTCGVCSGVK